MYIKKIPLPHAEWPYVIEFEVDPHWPIIYDWCVETFGMPTMPSVKLDNARWFREDPKWIKYFNGVRFRKLADAQWFMLRWSSEFSLTIT